MNEIIAEEVVEHEFNRFVECMDLDVDPAGMNADDLEVFRQEKVRIINAIKSGSLVISENGEPIFTPQRSKDAEAITFYEPTGASLMAMDRKKKTDDIGKLYATMADMTKTHPSVFSRMKMVDLKVCMAIAMLFLA